MAYGHIRITLDYDNDKNPLYGVIYRSDRSMHSVNLVDNLSTRKEAEVYQEMLQTVYKLGHQDAVWQIQYLVDEVHRESF